MITRLRAQVREIPGSRVHRFLPHRAKRALGSFCFVDAFGPSVLPEDSQGIGPHPHIGLQTVTWLFSGGIDHGDSEGHTGRARPGAVGLMTAGRGITHWERFRPEAGPLHGLQLWIALPDASRRVDPAFALHGELPVLDLGDLRATVFLGSLAGARSPARVFAPMVAAELTGGGVAEIPVDPGHEHGLLLIEGSARAGHEALEPGELLAFEPGPTSLHLETAPGSRVVLLGGPPFDEPLLLWWNFVARTHDEIALAREGWAARTGFGDPADWPTDHLDVPPLPPTRLAPRTGP